MQAHGGRQHGGMASGQNEDSSSWSGVEGFRIWEHWKIALGLIGGRHLSLMQKALEHNVDFGASVQKKQDRGKINRKGPNESTLEQTVGSNSPGFKS